MTTRPTPLQAIRAYCRTSCRGRPSDVRRCAAVLCPLHAYRMGGDPRPGKRRPNNLANLSKSATTVAEIKGAP